MRIAFATNPAVGHLLPLLPLATAARDAGHDVRVLAGASLAGAIGRAGLVHVAAGPPDLPWVFSQIPERIGLTGRRHAVVIWSCGFAGIPAGALADALLDLAAGWRPDLVVHDDSEQGSRTGCGSRMACWKIRVSRAGTATGTWRRGRPPCRTRTIHTPRRAVPCGRSPSTTPAYRC